MGKNKYKHRQPQFSPPAPIAPVPPSNAPLPEPPETIEAAAAAVAAAHAQALESATPAELDATTGVTPPTGSVDIVAAAKKAHEALALCGARESRLRAREAQLAETETRVKTREDALKKATDELAAFEQTVKTERRRVDADDQSLRARRLNAEAGFAEERRTSLQQLEGEAVILREELSRARAQIAKERAVWETQRRTEDDERRDRAVEAQRLREDETCADREAISADRVALKKRAAVLDVERQLLDEDRAAFEERVTRKAAALLEDAAAKQRDLEARLAEARTRRDELYEKLRDHDGASRALGHRPLAEVKTELDSLARERDLLKAQLDARPNHDVSKRLTALENEKYGWESDRARLTQEHAAAKEALARSTIAVTELESLRDQKAALESGRDLLHARLEELRKDVNERIRGADGKSPFPACRKMDEDSELQTQTPTSDAIPDLAGFCRDLQHRIALDPDTDKVLYYSLPDVRCFLAGLAMSRLHLLHGISGTGKTSLPLAFARALGAGSKLVEVQAGWRDRQDLIGHFNAFERRFYESEFLQALYEAQCPRYADLVYIVVLDEMNLSHPEQYFADLLSALELDPLRQKLDLMTAPVDPAPALMRQGRTLGIPQNVWFVGTANHDETTKDFADKTYDRAHVMELPRHRETFPPQRMPARPPFSFRALRGAFEKAQAAHQATAKGAYRFLDEGFADILGRSFRVGWGNRLERQMLEFVPVVIAAGGGVGEAVDHILATKLLRKIRDKHDTRPEDLLALRTRLADKWPSLDPKTGAPRSEAIIRDELRRLGTEEDA